MPSPENPELKFESQTISAKFVDPAGKILELPIEIRTNPITGRTCRLAFSRINDLSGFEVMLGDMTTFVAPEQTASWARPFFA